MLEGDFETHFRRFVQGCEGKLIPEADEESDGASESEAVGRDVAGAVELLRDPYPHERHGYRHPPERTGWSPP